MSSPFKAFRKHQKVLIVFFGILLMVSFLVVGTVTQFLGTLSRESGSASDTAFTWKEGAVSEQQLNEMHTAHRIAARFTEEIVKEAHEKGQKGPPQAMPVQLTTDDVSLVQRMLLARKAEELGIVVDDAAVSDYLNKLGDSRVSAEDRGRIFRGITRGGSSQSRLMEQLRLELLARRMSVIAHTGFASVTNFGMDYHQTPLDSWEHYNNLLRSVRVELYPVNVKDYVSKVKEPSEAEISKFYEEYKNQVRDPAYPEPGFKQPEMSKFEYVKADYSKFLDAEKKKVSDEEVKKYYEEHKADFIKPVLPEEKPAADEKTSEQGAAGEKEGSEAPKPPAPDKSKAPPAPPESKEPPAPPADDKSEAKDAKPVQAGPGATGPEATPEPKADAAQKPSPDGAAALTGGRKSGDLLAFEPAAAAAVLQAADESEPVEKTEAKTEAAQEPSSEPPAGEKPAANKPAGGKAPAAANKADKNQSPDKTEASPPKPETSKAETPPSAAGEGTSNEGASKEASSKESAAEEKPPEYKPLSEVEDQIRAELADKQAARKRMIEQAGVVETAMRRYYDLLRHWKARNPDKDPLTAADSPKPPKLTKVIEDEGLMLSAETTSMMDMLTASDTELGKAFEQLPPAGPNFQSGSSKSFLMMAYGPAADRTLYVPEKISTPDPGEPEAVYLFWCVAYEPEKVPGLKEVRPAVVQAWKMQLARPLAEKAAKDLAAKARKQPDVSLKKSLGEAAILTEPFTHNASFSNQMTTSVTGVKYVGPDFLNAVFSLNVGGIDTAMDEPKEHAYVIRLAEDTMSPEQRRQQFLRFAGSSFLMQGNAGNLFGDWLADLNKEMQLDWKRPPNRGQMM